MLLYNWKNGLEFCQKDSHHSLQEQFRGSAKNFGDKKYYTEPTNAVDGTPYFYIPCLFGVLKILVWFYC